MRAKRKHFAPRMNKKAKLITELEKDASMK
jgi:hypothetical protein